MSSRFTDDNGLVRLEGSLSGTVPATSIGGVTVSGTPSAGQVLTATSAAAADWETGGGYTPPTARAQYQGAAALSIANNGQAELPWDRLLVGTALLDLTTPTEPLVVTAGIYSVNVDVRPADAMTASGWWQLVMDLDATGQDAQMVIDSAPAAAAHTSPLLCASMTYYVPAGGMITVIAANHDGVQAIHFTLIQASIQRVT